MTMDIEQWLTTENAGTRTLAYIAWYWWLASWLDRRPNWPWAHVGVVFRNQLCSALLVAALGWPPPGDLDWTSGPALLWMALWQSGWFYLLHRSLHQWAYAWHAQHHSMAPVRPLHAFYCSLTEHLLVNTLTTWTAWRSCPWRVTRPLVHVWYLTAVAASVTAHAELVNAEHLVHHCNPRVNFGPLRVWDWLGGTLSPAPKRKKSKKKLK